MILYLSSPQHTNLLDFTGFYEPEGGKVIKKLVGSFVLKQFVIYDMRNFSHFTEVVLDRTAFGDTDEEFVQAIREFLTMYSARVTVICEGLRRSDVLFGALLESGIMNIVCDTEIRGIQQEITECLSEGGMRRYVPEMRKEIQEEGKEKTERYDFKYRNVMIAVAGSQARVGTTAVAIGLCTWLARVGASVCYIEANQSGHLEALARGYGMEQEADGWKYEGVHYGWGEPQWDVNFHVYDLGDAMNGRRDILECVGLKLLVCGTKPHELGFSVRLQREFAGVDAWLLCPFVADEVKEELTEAFQNEWHKVRFPGYQPELTDGGCNGGVYKEIVAEYILGK